MKLLDDGDVVLWCGGSPAFAEDDGGGGDARGRKTTTDRRGPVGARDSELASSWRPRLCASLFLALATLR